MALKLITAPAIEPVGLQEALNFLQIDYAPDSTVVTDMIAVARRQAEIITGRQLISATWELRMDTFPATIYLPNPPLQSITTFKYLDASGVEQSLVENTNFIVDAYSEPARLTPAFGEVWPVSYSVFNAVRVKYLCGYGVLATDVPGPIRAWIKTFIGALYENRETDIVSNTAQALTKLKFLDGLLDDYRVYER